MTFDYNSLFNKSRQLIEKSIVARNADQLDDCQLWAALALEILAKATLAGIHPALVADPNCSDSLFAACGRPEVGTNRRSISATIAYMRIKKLTLRFDQQFCLEMADRRNAQLHSGEMPYTDMRLDDWMPKYWSVCKEFLKQQGKSLQDWVGDDEAGSAEEIVKKRMTALQQAVWAKIKARREEFQAKYPDGSVQREALQVHDVKQQETHHQLERDVVQQHPQTADIPWPYAVYVVSNVTKSERCPACHFQGVLTCQRINDGPVTVEPCFHGSLMEVWEALAFRCEICGLRLDGREELEIARVETEIHIEVYRVGS